MSIIVLPENGKPVIMSRIAKSATKPVAIIDPKTIFFVTFAIETVPLS